MSSVTEIIETHAIHAVSNIVEGVQAQRERVQEKVDQAIALEANISSGEAVDIQAIESLADAEIRGSKKLKRTLETRARQGIHALNTFRTEHALDREVQHPSPLVNTMLLGTMIGVEAVISASFFQNAHLTATPTAAFLTSALISATNILASATAGFFIGRYLSYGKNALTPEHYAPQRNRARFLLCGFIAVMALFHLTVGAIREQESLVDLEISVAAYLRIFHTPEAFFLVITGACLSLITFYKSLSAFSDPYPGYSSMSASVDDINEEIEDTLYERIERLEEIFDDADGNAAKAFKTNIKAIINYNKKVKEAKDEYRKLISMIDAAKSTINQQTKVFEEKFSAVSAGEKPKHPFGVVPDFDSMLDIEIPALLPLPETSPDQQKLEKARSKAVVRLRAVFAE